MQCPKEGCDGDEAAFYQVQIRSADEPMTGFYRVSFVVLFGAGNVANGVILQCMTCGNQWREN